MAGWPYRLRLLGTLEQHSERPPQQFAPWLEEVPVWLEEVEFLDPHWWPVVFPLPHALPAWELQALPLHWPLHQLGYLALRGPPSHPEPPPPWLLVAGPFGARVAPPLP